MEENPILSALSADEKLLWSGKAHSFETLDAVYKPKLIKDTIIAVVTMIALIVGYILLASKTNADIMPAVIAVIVVCCGIAPVSTLLNARKLRKNICCAATDKRLITSVEGKAKCVEFALIKTAKVRTDAAGVTSFVCGRKAVKAPEGKLRSFAVAGGHIDEEKKECDCLVFYGIEDADKLKNILKPYINIE